MDEDLLEYQTAVKDSKFLHLLKPIRDLAQNWNIDIASELEDYLQQLDQIVYSFDGGTGVDFAEAALLIQSSAVVYSKKVEYLQQLVHKAIEASRARARSNDGEVEGGEGDTEEGAGRTRRARNRGARDNMAGDSLEAFMSAGDDLEEADDIDLGTALDGDGQVPTYTRQPAALLALEDQSNNGDAGVYRVARCHVHVSGALVLDYRDGSMYDAALQPLQHRCTDGQPNYAQQPPPARPEAPDPAGIDGGVAAQNDDDDDGHDVGHMDTGFDNDDDDNADDTNRDGGDAAGSLGECEQRPPTDTKQPAPEPVRGDEQPPDSRHLSPFTGRVGVEPGSPGGGGGDDAATFFDPYEKLDPNAAGDLPIKPMRIQKPSRARQACLARRPPGGADGPAWVAGLVCQEFAYAADLLRARHEPKPRAAQQTLTAPAGARTAGAAVLSWQDAQAARQEVHAAVAVADDDDDGGDGGAGWVDTGFGGDDDGDGAVLGDVVVSVHDVMGVVVDGAGWDAPAHAHADGQSYEDLCRSYMDSRLAAASAAEVQSELAQRVASWRTRIDPILKAEDSKHSFDLQSYGRTILRRMAEAAPPSSGKAAADAQLRFEAVAGSATRTEVSRAFAAMLQLVNNRNVALSREEGARPDAPFTLQLLTEVQPQEEMAARMHAARGGALRAHKAAPGDGAAASGRGGIHGEPGHDDVENVDANACAPAEPAPEPGGKGAAKSTSPRAVPLTKKARKVRV